MVQPEGNYYDKYGSKSSIEVNIMKGFFDSLELTVKKALTEGNVRTCLEAGCGEGKVISHIRDLTRAEASYYAFDISEQLIEKNKSEYEDIRFFCHNIYEEIGSEFLPESGKYDLILCCEVLEHMDDPVSAIKNLMKYSDRFVFSVPNEPIWRILNMARGKYWKDLGNTPGHVGHYSTKKFVRLLESVGLNVVFVGTPLPWTMVYCKR